MTSHRTLTLRRLALWIAVSGVLFGAGCASAPRAGALRHVVLFKFKASATGEQIKAIEDQFRRLTQRIPQIIDLEWGIDNSPEPLADGFTHCFLVTFADAAGRAAYLPHPAHQEFAARLGPSLDKVLVIDYFAAR